MADEFWLHCAAPQYTEPLAQPVPDDHEGHVPANYCQTGMPKLDILVVDADGETTATTSKISVMQGGDHRCLDGLRLVSLPRAQASFTPPLGGTRNAIDMAIHVDR